jgi:hypothetical protein
MRVKTDTRVIPLDPPNTKEGHEHHLVGHTETETYTLQRACATGRLWLFDAITVGLFVLVVIGMANY